MSRSRAFLFVSFVVLAGGCGARPDLLDGYGGGDGDGGDGGDGSGASGAGTGTGATGAGAAGAGTGTGASGGGGSTGTGASGGGGSTGTGASGGGGSTGTGASGGGTTTGTGTATVICNDFGDPCTECVAVECPERWCDCVGNSSCLGLLQCAGDCSGNDPGCTQVCYTQFESGISDAALITDCAGSLCPAQCPGNGGSTLDDCTECILQDCETEINDCLAAPECLQLYDCLTNQCGPLDLMCQDACYDTYDAGISKLQTMLTCAGNECPNACN